MLMSAVLPPPTSGALLVQLVEGARPLRLFGWGGVELEGTRLLSRLAPEPASSASALVTGREGMPAALGSCGPDSPAGVLPPEQNS